MRKINVQKDVDSRRRIANATSGFITTETFEVTAPEPVPEIEPEKEEVTDAQRQDISQSENDQSPVQVERAKKGGRAPKRDPEEV